MRGKQQLINLQIGNLKILCIELKLSFKLRKGFRKSNPDPDPVHENPESGMPEVLKVTLSIDKPCVRE